MNEFKPWVTPSGRSPQREALEAVSDYPTVVYRSGSRCGKDELGVAFLLQMARSCGGNGRNLLVSTDTEDALDDIWSKLEAAIGPDSIEGVNRAESLDRVWFLDLKCGCRIKLDSAENAMADVARDGRHRLFGLTAAWFNEAHPSSYVEAVRDDLRQPQKRLCADEARLLVTATPVGGGWLWLRDLERKPDTRVVRASMTEAASAGMLHVEATREFLDSLGPDIRALRDRGDYLDD